MTDQTTAAETSSLDVASSTALADRSKAAEVNGPVFLDEPSARTRTIPLRWPFLLGEVEYRAVTLRRISGQEAKAYYAATLATLRHGAPVAVFPGLDISQAAWEALDDDDVYAIEQAIEDFLPERFQPLIALLGKMLGPEEEPEEGAAGASFSGGFNSDIGGSSPA